LGENNMVFNLLSFGFLRKVSQVTLILLRLDNNARGNFLL